MVAFGGKLVGVVSLRELTLCDPGVAVEDVMTENLVYVRVWETPNQWAQYSPKPTW